MIFSTRILALAALVACAAAHPGEHHDLAEIKRQIVARDNAARLAARSLGQCASTGSAQSLKTRNIERRAAKVKAARAERGISSPARNGKRDLEDLEAWEAINHNMTGILDYDMFTSLEQVFDANTSSILSPEVTAGPYYVIGEFMRSNVKEARYSDGVDVYLEIQYIDVNTCQPVPAVAVDIWNCNATGTYSGISTNGNYAADGLNSTYLRGVQLTDHEGVASFETIFPGHYDGRAVHTHLLAHTNGSVQGNGTISVWDAPVAHIGQLFWPENLRSEVEETYPYTLNEQALTTNEDDMWAIVQADESYDPFPQYVYLGDSIEDGLFAWIQIGINASADYTTDDYYAIAAYLDDEGGHSTGNSVGGGGGGEGGPPAGNETAPDGALTGTPPVAQPSL